MLSFYCDDDSDFGTSSASMDGYDETLMKSVLSFLDDVDETSGYISYLPSNVAKSGYSSHFAARQTGGTYETATSNSNVSLHWSRTSNGSLPIYKEIQPTSLYGVLPLPYGKWSDPKVVPQSIDEASFLRDVPSGTSTPVKARRKVEFLAQQNEEMVKCLQKLSFAAGLPELDNHPIRKSAPEIRDEATPQRTSSSKKYLKSRNIDAIRIPCKPVPKKAQKHTLKRQENKENDPPKLGAAFCKFCFKNGEPPEVFNAHITKSLDGSVLCPILRKYKCDLCGATGRDSHTRTHCPMNTEIRPRAAPFRRLSNGVVTTRFNHK